MAARTFSGEVTTLATSTDNLSPSPLPEVSGRDLGGLLAPPGFRGIPRYLSDLEGDIDLTAAERGAQEIKLDLKAQGYQVAALLEARRADGKPLYRRVGEQFSRRSQKTTATSCVLLGRCLTIPGYKVVSTAQDGTRASTAIRELMYLLDPDSAEYTLRWGNGGEAIVFANGSRWERRPPEAGTFRGYAADAIWLDEAGEYDPAKSASLVQGVLPLMDTRPLGQIIITGTPAASRAGLLWDTIEAAREGKPGIGAIDYGMTEEDDPADENVWWRCHPGLASGLTDIEVIRERFEQMPLPAFMTEYLGYWPLSATDRAISAEAWESTAEGLAKPDTERFTVGLSVAPDSSSAALVVAWRDSEGLGHVSVTEHRSGTDWLPGAAHRLLTKYPRARLAYDSVGANIEPVQVLLRERRIASRVVSTASKEVQAGQASLVRLLHAGGVRHPDQPSLNAAADVLQWREVREKGRWFGWSRSGGDITPIAAASLALWDVDQNPRRKVFVIGNG